MFDHPGVTFAIITTGMLIFLAIVYAVDEPMRKNRREKEKKRRRRLRHRARQGR